MENDDTSREAELFIESGEWVIKETNKLIDKYKSCKTAHEQSKLIPQLQYLAKKLYLEKKGIERAMGL